MKYFPFFFQCWPVIFDIFYNIFFQKKKKIQSLEVNLHCQPLLLIPRFLKIFKSNLKITPMKIDIDLLEHHSRLCSQVSDLYPHPPLSSNLDFVPI